MLGSAAVSVAISAAYFIGLKKVPHPWPAPDTMQFMSAMVHLLGAGFGTASDKFWPLSGIATTIFVAASFACAVRVGFNRQASPAQRFRASDTAAFMIAFMPVALAVAYGRGGQQQPVSAAHYSTLSLPIIYWSFISWRLGTLRLPAIVIQTSLCAIICVFSIIYAARTFQTGSSRVLRTAEIERELRSGAAPDVIIRHHLYDLFYMDYPKARKLIREGIRDFREAGFARYGSPDR